MKLRRILDNCCRTQNPGMRGTIRNNHPNRKFRGAVACLLLLVVTTDAFVTGPPLPKISTIRLAAPQETDDRGNNLDNLMPPDFNFARDSILFGENPSTKKNNSVLRLWRHAKSALPKVVTGAWNENCGEENPVGALYNLALIRLPVIVAFFVYLKNSKEGHPFLVDFGFGSGPLAMSPVIVLGLFILMLGPEELPVLIEKE